MKTSDKENQALKDVLSYQKDVADAELKINELHKTIQSNKDELEKLDSFTSSLPSLMEQRENILADIAMGMDKQAELKQLETTINEEEVRKKEHDESVAKASSTLKPAIVGLQRKLAIAEAELASLKEKKNKILEGFLKSEAEQIGNSYVESITNMTAKLKQLRAVGEIIKLYGGTIYNNFSSANVSVPIFNVSACLDNVHPTNPGSLKSVIEVGPHANWQPYTQSEVERLKGLGINL